MTVAPETLTIQVPETGASLDEWLVWLETIHPVSIDMGLERVSKVADRLMLRPLTQPLILVGGTNGKGSTVAMLSAIYTLAGYKVGAYTSPHIDHFCERIRIDQQMADEREVVAALAFIESQRAPQTLTYFEYTTLAAMRVFMQQQCDVYLFEVGLGGRLDATNLWDADCAVLTSIALDHESYLGSDLSVIATEKAAIARAGKSLIVGEINPPASLFAYADKHRIQLNHVGGHDVKELPQTAMSGLHQRRNAACALAAVAQLANRLPVSDETLTQALLSSSLSARFERLSVDGVEVILDVAHNPAGAQALAAAWQLEYKELPAQIIFAVLADKDVRGVITALSPIAAGWHCIGLDVARASPVEALKAELAAVLASTPTKAGEGAAVVQQTVHLHNTAEQAWTAACKTARAQGCPVLIAGSFHTIAALRPVITSHV